MGGGLETIQHTVDKMVLFEYKLQMKCLQDQGGGTGVTRETYAPLVAGPEMLSTAKPRSGTS